MCTSGFSFISQGNENKINNQFLNGYGVMGYSHPFAFKRVLLLHLTFPENESGTGGQ